MFFDETWTPGVSIGERRSDDPAACDSFGAFAHRIHRDLLAARSNGRIPEHVEV
ncbi:MULTISPECIES: hypothetical protein [unclassified Amycolatopsis]|uniref:hypothetical protein n=1 Tax=unclassified Amycolatopsis TaxID=2618356 RepID=UPI001C695697|nr:hypothetical protein [Amycolatopsis sp. DSM 110486]QYN20152.1 hypothetical protein K1T34_47690 [Amycolatopsis sp. DSM 110486]